jgi:hypothetical protein
VKIKPVVLFLILSCGIAHAQSAATSAPVPASEWRENYAYTLGVQAYVYGFPWVYLPTLRYLWVTQPMDPRMTPYAPVNHFWNGRFLADATYRNGGSPNNDTLYSIAWVDVTREPMVLSVPDMGDRYYTFEIASLDSDNFAYVGKRTTGSGPGNFAIVGPDWKGKLPKGVVALDPSRTPWVLIIGRTLVDNAADVLVVNKLQDQYRLTPLSMWGKPDATLPASRDVWKPFDPKTDPLAQWKTMNRAMTENPPVSRDALLIKTFATIGVGPGQDVDKMDEATKRGLVRAAVDGRTLLQGAISSGELGKRINYWNFPPRDFGRAGTVDDFLLRGALQCLGGIIANDPEEAVYANTALDSDGTTLDGSKNYVLHFASNQLPKVKAFWSITMYSPDYNLVDNPINRYSIGDRTPGVKRDADGGLTVYIQATSPAKDKESNWLPSTKSGPFLLILRTYMPEQEILEQTWQIPGVAAVK